MKKTKRFVALLLTAVMLLGALPIAAGAAWADDNVTYSGTSFGVDGYYTVISQKDWTLVPGAATETEMVLNNAAGTRRQVLHVVEVDPSNEAISIVPGYYGIDKDITSVANQQAATVTDMTAYYENVLGYNVVAGMNTALAYDNNAPYSWLVYNGNVLVDHGNKINDFHSGACQTMLCVYKNENGSCYCELRNAAEGLRGDEWQAIGANFAMVVSDGKLVTPTISRSDAAARSMIGVKEDGTLVLVMNDGRGANNSIGLSDNEEGEAMLALGCKWAFNCDGGGSSAMVTKRAGEETYALRCVPCDGAERPTINAVFIVSNVGKTGVLNNVNVTSDYDFFAPGTTYTFGADAIDTHGYAMATPADLQWQLSDASFGTIEGGTFVSNGKTGDVTIQAVSGGNVVGEKTITVTNPETLAFTSTETTLPYGRSATLEFISKQGEADVYLDGSSFTFTSSNPAAGTLNGLTFVSTTEAGVSGTTITATYVPTGKQLTFTVNLGLGSEVLWDFEDGDISDWVSTDAADKFMRDGGAPVTTNGSFSTPFRTLFAGGQISWSNKTYTHLSSAAAGGQAHGGDKALAVTFDMKNTEFNSWVYSIIWNIQGNIVLRDVANGKAATKLGMWVYVPKGFYTAKNNGAMALQLTVQRGASATSALSGTQLNLQYNGKNINALKEADIPENRWVYVTADLTGANFVKLVDPLNDVYRSPSFIRMYVKPSEAQELTYYFDDITLDYSSAVDDRTPPVISAPTYCTNDTNVDLNGQTINTDTVSFNATVADAAASNASGLNYKSAAIYIDGVKYAAKASGSGMSLENVVLSNGTHSVKFEIADNLGNATTLTKTLTVDAPAAKSAVRLSGHNDKNNTIEAGSVYYVDLVADAIEDVDSVQTTIKLQSAHEWELDHMILADGFTGSYTLNPVEDSIATVTITKTGETELTGTQTIASLPVRVWSYNEATQVGGDSANAPKQMTAAARFASTYGEPVLLVETSVQLGKVTYTNGASGSFYGSFSLATAVTGNKTKAWHTHDASLTVQNKEATCTEAGYANRTYCETCGSVVDWGTVVPATGHTFAFNEAGVLACTHDETHLFTGTWTDGKDYIDGVLKSGEDGWSGENYYVDGAKVKGIYPVEGVYYDFGEDGVNKGVYTGLFEKDGYNYYAVGGNIVSGWQQVDGEWYYFSTSDYRGVTGKVSGGNSGWLAIFNAVNGKIAEPYIWSTREGVGTRCYYSGGKYYHHEWATIDGEQYYFGDDGCRYEGYRIIKDSRYSHDNDYQLYHFAADGKLIEKMSSTGILATEDGTYYLENGYAQHKGLVYEDGYYYYFDSSFKAVTSQTRYISGKWLNDLRTAGAYTFDEAGRMVMLNGIVAEGEKLYYYVDGVRTHAGLIEIDGNLYYVKTDGEVVTNTTRYVDARHANGFTAGTYSFGADGAMLVLNGFVEENGKLYYYVNGVKTHAGMIQVGGDLYYVKTDGEVVTNVTRFVDERHANGFTAGVYTFGANGAAIIRNGVAEEGGKLYYFVNGAKRHAGLVAVDGYYYYATTDGSVVVNAARRIDARHNNGLLEPGVYTFNAQGQIVDELGEPISAN